MSLPKTMRAAVVEAHGKPLVIKDVALPVPGENDVLVKLEMSGVCHTDIHVQDGDWSMKSALPIIPGHEGVGVVVKAGSGVVDIKEGDRVCTPWMHSACGRCEHCCAGWETVCDQPPSCTGFTVDGSFAEYIKANADYVGKVPDGVSSEQCAPITCAGVTVYKGLKMTEVKPGQWVVIVGAGGGLGHLAVQYAKAMGMKIIGIDVGAEKLPLIKSLGADMAIDAKSGNVNQQIIKATTAGAHGSIILVPVRTAVQDAVQYCRKRATIVQIALPPGNLEAHIFDVVCKAMTIRGSIVGTRLDLKEALQWAAEGKVKCNIEVRGFSEVNTLMDELRSGKVAGRLVMDMTK